MKKSISRLIETAYQHKEKIIQGSFRHSPGLYYITGYMMNPLMEYRKPKVYLNELLCTSGNSTVYKGKSGNKFVAIKKVKIKEISNFENLMQRFKEPTKKNRNSELYSVLLYRIL